MHGLVVAFVFVCVLCCIALVFMCTFSIASSHLCVCMDRAMKLQCRSIVSAGSVEREHVGQPGSMDYRLFFKVHCRRWNRQQTGIAHTWESVCDYCLDIIAKGEWRENFSMA